MESTPPILFDRARLRKRRLRAAPNFAAHDFLHQEAAARLADSLAYINRPFPTIVELGAHTGALASHLKTRPGTTRYLACDLIPGPGINIAVDEEFLPFAENSVDAVVSCLALHWVNDLPGTLAQIARILKPDGLFIAMLPGSATLEELRDVFARTETQMNGGLTPRVAPFIDVRDAGALLQRAGFALPVADNDPLTITYPTLFALMEDLRNNAQVNMLQARTKHFTARRFFMEAASLYAREYGDAEGRIPATVDLITLTGWKPASSQQQPAKRGSGKVSLTTALQ